MNEVVGGRLLTNTSADVVEYCAGQSDDILLTDLSGSRGTQVLYVLTDFQRNIIEIFPTSSIDLSTLSSGGFFLTAVSFAGPLEGLTGGASLNNLSGCHALSSDIVLRVNAIGVSGGSLTVEGATVLEFCDNPGIVVPELTGQSGQDSDYIVTDVDGDIIFIGSGSPLDLTGITESLCFLRHVSSSGGLEGLELGTSFVDLEGCFELSNSVQLIKFLDITGQGLSLIHI